MYTVNNMYCSFLAVLSVVLLVVAAVRYRSKKAEQQKTQVYELVEQMIGEGVGA